MDNHFLKLVSFFGLSLALLGCSVTTTSEKKPIVSVTHKQPTEQFYGAPISRYMAFYRTEVKNLSDEPIKVITFEGYGKENGVWYPGNITGSKLTSEDFTNWYSEGDKIKNGVIQPYQTAVCDVNWHGTNFNNTHKVKWSYTIIDSKGQSHYVEAEVDPSITNFVDFLDQ